MGAHRQFTPEIAGELGTNGLGGIQGTEEMHELGEGGLGGHVRAGNHPCIAEQVGRGVPIGVDGTMAALAHMDRNHAPGMGALEERRETREVRGVPGAECREDEAAERRP